MVKSNAPVVQSLWRRHWLGALFLVAATVLVYHRMWQAGFIWDDDSHLTQNPCIIGPLGLKEIWISSRAYYYPLVLTSFWVLHKFVGLNPLPYHILNVLTHAGAAVLLWRVLQQLNVRGAWLGAALWALHPVMVESVAWVTELKNTQSCFFYLLSILFFFKADTAETNPPKRQWRFGLSLLFFAMAITSKSATVMLPVVLGLCLWWRRGSSVNCPFGSDRLNWRDLALLAPFLFISTAASGWTIWEQKFHSGALGAEFAQTWLQRLAVAGRDIWFYLGKLLWPNPLIFIYPRWKIDIYAFLPFLAAAVGLFLLWWKRNGPLRPVFFAAAYFVVSLFPVLGFFNVYFFRYSFVSDHFQYLASIGPLALAASGIVTGLRYFEKIMQVRLARWLQPILCGLVLLTLGILTWRQTEGYHDVETLWRTTIARNPECPLAHLNLGVLLKERGQRDDAKAEYLEALKINPDYAEALTTLGVCEAEEKQFEKAISSFEAAIKSDPNYSPAWYDMGNAFRDEGKSNEAIASYQTALQMWSENQEAHNNLAVALSESGKQAEAIAHFREALRLKPTDAGAHNNLGVVLMQLGQLDEAVNQFKEALRLNRTSMQTYVNLAQALVQLGRRQEAVDELKEALRVKPDFAEARQQLQQLGAPLPPL